ncbi:Zn-dependent hydrolase, glyoxylase [Desulfoscipio gibsoniae DSM 7213]|uniref:Zn-dependent hydrolase, glyoxylase n=1 Tax=Desulfoscipio gibsoniae DSM 7213 TaxID=767817 RepID=R4KNP9_9FIRM|nr:Zn-dependent hydrolase, glyoxylase [Desulfoscipio gibsoniae DSM 7213]
MLPVYQMVIPTPYPVGPVNAYLIKGDPITLVDVGPDMPQAYKVLRDMLSSLDCRIEDIKRIVITHSHPDHCGLAAQVAKEANAVVLIHSLEESKLSGEPNFFKERISFVLETGIPPEVIQEIMADRDKLPHPSVQGVHTRLINGGESIDFDGGELQVMHLPGHSPGHLCLYNPEQKFLFSGDFLLPHITPNPLMEPDHDKPGCRLPALKQYLSGLDTLEKMDIAMVFPGHGGTFNDFNSVINVGRRHHNAQFERIKDKLRAGELNAFQLSRTIYPGLRGWQVFLGLSEIQAHLDLLVEKGQINCSQSQGVNYYSIS